jgi:hypothetical protein
MASKRSIHDTQPDVIILEADDIEILELKNKESKREFAL